MAKVKNEATRQKILCAAYRRFTDDGYENVLLKDIAADCEISLSLLQHYYRKKEMILTHIFYDLAYKVLIFQKSHVSPALLESPHSAHLADTVYYELLYSLFRADHYRLLKLYRWVLNNAAMLNEGILLCRDFLAELYGVAGDGRNEIPVGTYVFNGTMAQLIALYFVRDTMTAPLDDLLKLARTVYYRYYRLSEKAQKELFAAAEAIVTPELQRQLREYYLESLDHFVDMK